MSNTQSRTVNITIPTALLKKVDALAERDYTSRSDIIRQALLDKIRKPQTDEWGDEGKWETIADFSEINPEGISAEEFIQRLKALDGQDR